MVTPLFMDSAHVHAELSIQAKKLNFYEISQVGPLASQIIILALLDSHVLFNHALATFTTLYQYSS